VEIFDVVVKFVMLSRGLSTAVESLTQWSLRSVAGGKTEYCVHR